MNRSVSCIITNYNYGQFVVEAITSVLQQTQPVDQIVVVDDGSTDDSVKLINSFGSKITLLQQSNSGVVVARNNGAAQAVGDYLFFLDADDVLEPDYVKILVAALEAGVTNDAVAYCDFCYFGSQQGRVAACPWSVKKLLYRNYIIGAAIIKRQAFMAVGGYNMHLNQKASFEDWDLWLKLAESGYGGAYVPQVLFKYRLHGTGRNGPALKQRAELEARLRQEHDDLYRQAGNRLYLALFGTASKIRNALIKAPGT